MLPDFRIINRTFNRPSNTDPDDVLNLKVALSDLGLYKAPKWGITSYPDRDLFKAVETFQRSNHLKVDGVIKPNGPTEHALSVSLNVENKKRGALTQSLLATDRPWPKKKCKREKIFQPN